MCVEIEYIVTKKSNLFHLFALWGRFQSKAQTWNKQSRKYLHRWYIQTDEHYTDYFQRSNLFLYK